MLVLSHQHHLFLRLDPGEPLIGSLCEVMRVEDIRFGAIVSGVGMLTDLELGFFQVARNDYVTGHLGAEILDLSNVVGNLSWREGAPAPHVHIVANRPDWTTVSGHLMEARAHITMEIVVAVLNGLELARRVVPGFPATRLCPLG